MSSGHGLCSGHGHEPLELFKLFLARRITGGTAMPRGDASTRITAPALPAF